MCTYQDHMFYQESEMIAKFEMAAVMSLKSICVHTKTTCLTKNL